MRGRKGNVNTFSMAYIAATDLPLGRDGVMGNSIMLYRELEEAVTVLTTEFGLVLPATSRTTVAGD